MRKSKAIELLGGTLSATATAIGVTPQAVMGWPDPLPRRIEDRVVAALARKHLPSAVLDAIGGAVSECSTPSAVAGDRAEE